MIENVGRIWLQLNGIQGNFKLTHKPIDYQNEIQKWSAQLKKDEHYKKAQENGWISPDDAASGAIGVEKAFNSNIDNNEGGN